MHTQTHSKKKQQREKVNVTSTRLLLLRSGHSKFGVNYDFSIERQVVERHLVQLQNSKAGGLPVCCASGMTSGTKVVDKP